MENILNWDESIKPWLLHSGLKILIILVIAYILHKVASTFITKTVRVTVRSKNFHTKEAEKQRETTLIQIFTWTAGIVIFVVTILMLLQEVGIAIGPVLASVGIVGLALGFGGQYLIRDIISGLFIILENQYRIGDVVDFDGTSGSVTEITLRMTTLRDMDGTVHHVPHGEIKKVSNLTKDFANVNLDIGIAYETNLEHAITIINDIGNTMMDEPLWKKALNSAPQFLRIDSFDDSAMTLKITAQTQPGMQWAVTGELRKRLKIAFDNVGIDIPYPQRVIHQARPKSTNQVG